MSETPMEQGAAQAAQTAAMSVRFLVTIAMAVSEQQAKENPARAAQITRLRQLDQPGESAVQRYAGMVREEFKNAHLSEALLNSAQWPQIAEDLRSLESAGIDVPAFLRDAGRVAERVAATVTPQPTPEQMVREHMGDRLAKTLTSSERWPQIADEMRQMQAAGIDMPQMLAAVAEPGAKVEAAMTEAWEQQAARVEKLEKGTAPSPVRGTPVSRAESRRGGSNDRSAALVEVGLSTQENQKFIRALRENVDSRHTAEVLVVSNKWPQVAASMRDLESRGIDPGPRLARLPQIIASQAANGGRASLIDAAQEALRHAAPGARQTPALAERQTTSAYHPTPARSAADGVTISPEQLRTAAHHVVGAVGGVNAQTLSTDLGVGEQRARAMMAELNKRDIIGQYDLTTDRYQVQVTSTKAADALVNGEALTASQANKAGRQASDVARAISTTAEAPKAKTSGGESTAVQRPATPTQSRGRTR